MSKVTAEERREIHEKCARWPIYSLPSRLLDDLEAAEARIAELLAKNLAATSQCAETAVSVSLDDLTDAFQKLTARVEALETDSINRKQVPSGDAIRAIRGDVGVLFQRIEALETAAKIERLT